MFGDISGFAAAVLGWIYAENHGVNAAIIASARDAFARGAELKEVAKTHLHGFFAGKSFWMLLITTLIELVAGVCLFPVLALAWDAYQTGGVRGYHVTFLIAGVLLLLKIAYLPKMAAGIPRYLMVDGVVQRHPRYLQNPAGRWTARDGRVLTYEEDVYEAPLAFGTLGTPLRLNDEGLAYRYYEQAGFMVDATTERRLRYANGQAKRFNRRGEALRFYQLGAVWFDSITGLALAADPTDPDVILPADRIDRKETLPGGDRRVQHRQADMPMLDPDAPNALGSNSFWKASFLTVASMLIMGLSIVWLGLLKGDRETFTVGTETYGFIIGSRTIVALGGMYLLLGLSFARAQAWILMGVYAKTVQAAELIAGIASDQGLVLLPGITWANIRSRIPSASNLIDEARHRSAVLGLLLEGHLTFLIWFMPVFILPVVPFAVFFAGVMFTKGGVRYLFRNRDAEEEVRQEKRDNAKWYNEYFVMFFVLVTIVLSLDGLRHDLLTQVSHLIAGVQSVVNGRVRLPFPVWYLAVPALAIVTGLAFFLIGRKTGVVVGAASILVLLFVPEGEDVGLPVTKSALASAVAEQQAKVLSSEEARAFKIEQPKNVKATYVPQARAVIVTWTDVSEQETAYRVERREPDNTWSLQDVPAPNTHTWKDINVRPGVKYAYRIVAVGSNWESPPGISAWTLVDAESPKKKAGNASAPAEQTTDVTSDVPAATHGKKPCSDDLVAGYKRLNNGAWPPKCLQVASAP